MADDGELAAAAAVRKGPWTVQEDQVLVDYIAANGEGSWNYLARAAGLNRTGKSCRLRWLNYLRPDLRRGKLTAEEQDLVVHLHSQWGNRWSKIAEHLPGRTDNEVKNFWRTKIQQKKRQRRQHKDGTVITAAGLCSSGVDNDGGSGTPATTEGCQGSSGGTTAAAGVGDDVLFVTHDYGIVTHQPRSMCCRSVAEEGHLGDGQLQIHGGGAAGSTCWSAAAMDFLPELLAASGENFWAIDDFWSTTQSCLGPGNTNNEGS